MDESQVNDLIKKLYRERIEREISRPDFALEKERFITRHFSPEPAGIGIFSGRMIPEFLSPALALMLVFAVFNFLLPVSQRPAQAPADVSISPAAALSANTAVVQPRKEDAKQMKKLLGKMKKTKHEPAVIVKEVSSQVGSTMVYHKKHEETPITVVWVFTKGQGV